jgi:hypothetical protein
MPLTVEETRARDKEDLIIFTITLLMGILIGSLITWGITTDTNNQTLVEKGYASWQADQKTGKSYLVYNSPATQPK